MNNLRNVLTDSEYATVALVAVGLSNDAIAARLGVSIQTVKNTLGKAAIRMGLSGGSARVRMALVFHGLPVESE